MKKKKSITAADVEPLIEEKRGNVSAIGRVLGVSRMTVQRRIDTSERLKKALHDARESMIDNAESVLNEKVLEGDITALIFFLKTQGRRRGYSERFELSRPEDEASDNLYQAIEKAVNSG